MIRIKEIRKAKKITAKELAVFVNVAESTMSLYENGKREPDYKTLLKIAEYLDVSIDYLLGKNDTNEPTIKKIATPGESINLSADPKGEALKVALFGGDTEVTDEMWNEVITYAEFLKQKYNKN